MRRLALALCVGVLFVSVAGANPMQEGKAGRYQIFSSPHAYRIYVLDTQTGRMFQLINYKDLNKEVLEEIPYIFNSGQICTPDDYENSPSRCFGKNYEYMKNLMDLRREQKESSRPAVPPATAPAVHP